MARTYDSSGYEVNNCQLKNVIVGKREGILNKDARDNRGDVEKWWEPIFLKNICGGNGGKIKRARRGIVARFVLWRMLGEKERCLKRYKLRI